MSEIVVAEPTNDEQNRGASTSSSTRAYYTRSITWAPDDYVPEPFDSEKLPITLLSEIQRFLRVANQIQIDYPRVAYLCECPNFSILLVSN